MGKLVGLVQMGEGSAGCGFCGFWLDLCCDRSVDRVVVWDEGGMWCVVVGSWNSESGWCTECSVMTVGLWPALEVGEGLVLE